MLYKKSDSFYLIEDIVLRNFRGNTIGKIAASQGQEVFSDQIQPSSTDIGFPMDWEINVSKLAGILRIADAIHVTSDRV